MRFKQLLVLIATAGLSLLLSPPTLLGENTSLQQPHSFGRRSTQSQIRHEEWYRNRAIEMLRDRIYAQTCDLSSDLETANQIFADGCMDWLEARDIGFTELEFALHDRDGDGRVCAPEYVAGPIQSLQQTTEAQSEYIAILILEQHYGHRMEWARSFEFDDHIQSVVFFDNVRNDDDWWAFNADYDEKLTAEEIFHHYLNLNSRKLKGLLQGTCYHDVIEVDKSSDEPINRPGRRSNKTKTIDLK